MEKPVQHWKFPWACKSKQNTFKFILRCSMMECTTQKTAAVFFPVFSDLFRTDVARGKATNTLLE